MKSWWKFVWRANSGCKWYFCHSYLFNFYHKLYNSGWLWQYIHTYQYLLSLWNHCTVEGKYCIYILAGEQCLMESSYYSAFYLKLCNLGWFWQNTHTYQYLLSLRNHCTVEGKFSIHVFAVASNAWSYLNIIQLSRSWVMQLGMIMAKYPYLPISLVT